MSKGCETAQWQSMWDTRPLVLALSQKKKISGIKLCSVFHLGVWGKRTLTIEPSCLHLRFLFSLLFLTLYVTHMCDSCAHVCWCMRKESSFVSLRKPQSQNLSIWLLLQISLLWGSCCCLPSLKLQVSLAAHWLFTWVMEIWTLVLTLACRCFNWWVIYPAPHLKF